MKLSVLLGPQLISVSFCGCCEVCLELHIVADHIISSLISCIIVVLCVCSCMQMIVTWVSDI